MKNLLILFVLLFALQTSAQNQFNVLLFTKTDGWHHESINEGVTAMRSMAKRHSFDLQWHEDATRFNDDFLAQFDVIVFLNTTGNILNEEQQEAFKKFIQSGKGFVGVHSASDTEYDWPWYNELVGKMFHIHPLEQSAMVDVVDTNFPGMEIFPKRFLWTDEWYEFLPEEYSENLNILLNVDEDSYDPEAQWGEKVGKGTGDHPIAWYQNFDNGRSFYTGLGHIAEIYKDPWFLHHLYGGIYWAATGNGIKK
ncbi:ThuA domain-containing protein [Salegentibacter sp. F188]|uniref:ThuA domain-containing protein n=1 Tax=Autumnicola patrickiae TaxID=3075591 RepID=A0ABU3E685_9FLAO|nr:ThuA domain-containing protein [Salegentibacter sp. F188]MDT0691154.1 ThuA domain-containing protein [Salegentibacter sp. F188]